MTKWVDAEAIPQKTAENVLRVLSRFVANHGIPNVLITDQGREFCNQLNDRFCEQFQIDHRVASPYHPQTGGHTERYNRTLCGMLAKYVNDEQSDWDEKINSMLFAYRTSVHSSTKETPFYLVYGRQPRLPVDLALPTGPVESLPEDFEELIEQRCQSFLRLNIRREGAAKNIKESQKSQKKYHDKKIKRTDIKVGDNVLVHNTRKTTRKGGKLSKNWNGPYVVENVLGKGTYRLSGLKHAINGNRLKLYVTRNVPPSQTTDDFETEKKHDKDKDDTPEKKCSHSEDDEEENTDGSFTQTAKSPGKRKKRDKDKYARPKKRCQRSKDDEENTVGSSSKTTKGPGKRKKRDKDVASEIGFPRSEADVEENSDGSSTQTAKVPGKRKKRNKDQDVSPKKRCQRSGDDEENTDGSSTQTAMGPGKRKKRDKDKNAAPEIRCPRSVADVEENIHSECSCPDGENSFEPLRDEKDSNNGSDPIIVWGYEGNTMVNFFPTDEQWQKTKSLIFDIHVKNINDNGRKRKMKITAEPGKIANMRGDGNCLFRAFSFIVFGVQTFHKCVREKLVSFMEDNKVLFTKVENTPMEQYLSISKMKELGTWGTEMEILAFSSLCNTTVYVFCNCGGQGWRWLPYKPLAGNSTNNPCVYLVNKYGHFEPVLDVQEEIYTRTPYLKIGDYLNRRYHHFLSQEMLDSSLVNAASDEQKLRDFEDINPPHVYTKKFTDRYCTPCRFNVDPNIFNLLCDWSDFEMYL